MTPYTAVLSVHVVAVLTLTAGIATETWMLYQMRRTPSLNEARLWLGAVPGLTVPGIVSLAIVLITGAYLTARLAAWAFAWPKLAVVGVLIFALLGALTGTRLRAIRRACVEGATKESSLTDQLRSPFLKLSASVRIWIVCGTVLLMSARPGPLGSIGIILGSAALGLISTLFKFRRKGETATASGKPANV
jgi:hypothetical protein